MEKELPAIGGTRGGGSSKRRRNRQATGITTAATGELGRVKSHPGGVTGCSSGVPVAPRGACVAAATFDSGSDRRTA